MSAGCPMIDALEHFPEKWAPVFRRKCDQVSNPFSSIALDMRG
jgi:hypothetical protein